MVCIAGHSIGRQGPVLNLGEAVAAEDMLLLERGDETPQVGGGHLVDRDIGAEEIADGVLDPGNGPGRFTLGSGAEAVRH